MVSHWTRHLDPRRTRDWSTTSYYPIRVRVGMRTCPFDEVDPTRHIYSFSWIVCSTDEKRLNFGFRASSLYVRNESYWTWHARRTVMDTHSISYAPDHRNAELLPALIQQNCVMEIWPFNCPLWNLQRCGNRLTRPYRWCGRQARLPFVSIAMSYQETIKVANEMMPTVVSSCAMISLYLKQTVWRGREAVLVRLSFKAKPAQTPTNLVTGWFRVSINSSSTAITCLSKTRQPLLSRVYQHNS